MKNLKKYGAFLLVAAAIIGIGVIKYTSERKKLEAMSEKTDISLYNPDIEENVNSNAQLYDKTNDNKNASDNSDKTTEDKTAVTDVFAEEKPQNEENNTEEEVSFTYPTDGEIICEYSGNTLLYNESMKDFRTHNGIDFKADEGEDVFAICGGTVEEISDDGFTGLTLTINHGNGLCSKYSSLESTSVAVGDKTDAGSVIGKAGCTAQTEKHEGTHLHLEVLKDGKRINPNECFK